MTYFHILLILSNCTLKQKLLATCYILGVSGHLVQKINCDYKFTDMFAPKMGSKQIGMQMHSALECAANHFACQMRIVVAECAINVIKHHIIEPWSKRYKEPSSNNVVMQAEVPIKGDKGENMYIDLLAVDRHKQECAVVEYKTITKLDATDKEIKKPLAKATKQATGYAAKLKGGKLPSVKCAKVHVYVGIIMNKKSAAEFALYKEG